MIEVGDLESNKEINISRDEKNYLYSKEGKSNPPTIVYITIIETGKYWFTLIFGRMIQYKEYKKCNLSVSDRKGAR